MARKWFLFSMGLIMILTYSCSHGAIKKDAQNAENRVLQSEDGTISLKLEEAACYSDESNPSGNTAEWEIVISEPGRFHVWLSSATKDTTDLSYSNSVRISILDKHLEADPACDKIIRNASEFPAHYFRADSYMGSFFVSEPGQYNIQIISEKVIAKNSGTSNTAITDDTMLMSVFLTPMTR